MNAARGSTRFAGWPPIAGRGFLAGLLAVIAAGLWLGLSPLPRSEFLSDDPMQSDTALYRSVIERLASGETYYDTVVSEHRARGYPLRPFVTVRLPTLAVLEGKVGLTAARIGLMVLAAAAIGVLALQFRTVQPIAAPALAALGIVPLADPDLAVWHEVWAGLLIAVSVGCRSRGRWAASLVLGLTAVAIRELALPYLAAMAFVAWREGERREAGAWLAGIGLAAAGLAAHAVAVAAHVQVDDLASPGWAGFGGLRLALTMVHATSALAWLGLPLAAAGPVVPLALLGWWSRRDGASLRVALTLTGYLCAFMFVGRTNNIYWGFLLSPLIFVGLAAAPAALRDLWSAARMAAPRQVAPT